jgi:hypothetical protein
MMLWQSVPGSASGNMLFTNQSPPELDAPPLQSPQLHPISIINLNKEPLNANSSPLTAPSITTGTRGSDVMETIIKEESIEATAAWQLVSIQNIAYECNERDVALSVPQTTAQLQFNARDSYHDGYDSDGELGPFFDAVMNEPSDSEDEEELTTTGAPSMLPLPTDTPPEQTQPPPPLLVEDAKKGMTVAQLKEELKKRKLTLI